MITCPKSYGSNLASSPLFPLSLRPSHTGVVQLPSDCQVPPPQAFAFAFLLPGMLVPTKSALFSVQVLT